MSRWAGWTDRGKGYSKYGNKKKVLGDKVFDSKGEAERWQELCLLEKAGKIFELRRQVPYALHVDGVHVCNYVADFVYRRQGETKIETVVEDFKSDITRKKADYRIKVKLLQAVYPGITFIETLKG